MLYGDGHVRPAGHDVYQGEITPDNYSHCEPTPQNPNIYDEWAGRWALQYWGQ